MVVDVFAMPQSGTVSFYYIYIKNSISFYVVFLV